MTRTPILATVIVTLIILIMALWLPLETLAKTTSATLLIIFSLVNLALFRIQRRQPAAENVFTVPGWVPLTGFLVSLLFLVIQFAA
jgi:amino acid transporter